MAKVKYLFLDNDSIVIVKQPLLKWLFFSFVWNPNSYDCWLLVFP